MLADRHALADLGLRLSIARAEQHGFAFGLLGQHHAPGIDDGRVAKRLPRPRMSAALIGRQHIALRFDGTGTDQHLPVRGARHGGEGRRRADQLGTLFAQGGVQLGKTQVITHRQPQAPHGRIGHHGLAAVGIVIRLAVAATTVGHIDIEQVQFVVARHSLALIIQQQRTGMGTSIGLAIGRQRNGSGHQPQTEITAAVTQPRQDRPFAAGTGRAQRRQITATDSGEVLRQHGQPGTGLRGLFQQTPGIAQVLRHVGLADHLNHCNRHDVSTSFTRQSSD